MSFSDYLENAALSHIFGKGAFTALTNTYVSLSTADPGEDAAGNAEPTSTGGYARITIAAANLTLVTNNISNTNAESYVESTVAWSTGATPLTHFGLWDALTVGNMIGSAALTTPRTVDAAGITLTFQAGELDVTLD